MDKHSTTSFMALSCLMFACLIILASCSASPSVVIPELLKPVEAVSDIVPVSRGDVIRWKQVEGIVTPYSEPLYFEASGVRLRSINVAPGQEVRAGEVLAELDMTDYLDKLDTLRDTLAHNERVWEHENALAELSIEIMSLEQISSSYERELAGYRLRETRQNLTLAKDLQALERERLRSRIAAMEATSEGYYIKAPFDGVIMHIADIKQGDTPGTRVPVIYIADMDRITINCTGSSAQSFKSEKNVLALVDGMEYNIEQMPFSSEEYMAFYFAETQAPVRFMLTDETVSLATDSFVLLRAFGGESKNILWLPPNAVHNEGGGVYYVYTDEDGARVRRNVKIGLESETRVEIKEGLDEGEMVYVD